MANWIRGYGSGVAHRDPPTITRGPTKRGWIACALLTATATAESTIAFNCGSGEGILANDGVYYAPDQPYAPGSGGGYVGGDSLSWTGTGLHHDWGDWRDQRLYMTLRGGDHSYLFETTPGLYEITLRWVDAESNGPGGRIVEVRLDGNVIVSGLDVNVNVGKSRSLDIRSVVTVADTTSMVEITGLQGRSTLAAIALTPFDSTSVLPAPIALDARPTYGGALLTWSTSVEEHLAAHRVVAFDSKRHLALPFTRHAPFAIVPADSAATCRIELLDSSGEAGASAWIANVTALPLSGSSPLPLAQLYVSEEDLREMERALPDKVRKPAALWMEGEERTGEVNFRGNTSLMLPKKSFKFRIDDGPDVDGSDIVSLPSNFLDRTLAKETLSCELLSAIGHPTYRSDVWRLMLNDKYAGVFGHVEEADELFLERIGLDPQGRCYKAARMCGKADRLEDFIDRYENANADDDYRRDIIRLMHEMSAVDDRDFEAWVRENFDLDEVLNWYAGQIYIGNRDFTCNNQILHQDRLGGPWRILAWDMDKVFRDATDPVTLGDRDHPNDGGRWSILIDRTLAVPSLMRLYLEHLESLLDGPLSTESVLDAFDRWMPKIVPDAEIDVAKFTRELSVPYHDAVDELEAFLAEREGFLRAQIDSLMPAPWVDVVINEVADHAPDTIVQSWVELHYRGRNPIAATGLYLSDDIDAPAKWPVPTHLFVEGDLLVHDLPEHLEPGDWIGLTLVTMGDSLILDSLTVITEPSEVSIGRVPDGCGRLRILPEKTLGLPNRWEDPLTAVATADQEVYDEGERVSIDLLVTSHWRQNIDVDLEVEVVGPGGIWWFDGPIDLIPLPSLSLGDTVTTTWRERLPRHLFPENEGRFDLVFTPVNPQGQRLAPAVATIYALGDPIGSLVINELCASNTSIIADQEGEFEDWVEIVNAADSVLSTANLYLSDDVDDDALEWAFPTIDLDPGERLLIWLDDEPDEGPLHAPFKLDRDGEELGLVRDAADSIIVLDRIPFGYQESDWSFGRYPDAAPNWELFDAPSPARTNVDPVLRY